MKISRYFGTIQIHEEVQYDLKTCQQLKGPKIENEQSENIVLLS